MQVNVSIVCDVIIENGWMLSLSDGYCFGVTMTMYFDLPFRTLIYNTRILLNSDELLMRCTYMYI